MSQMAVNHFVEPDGAILKDRPDLDRELTAGMLGATLPPALIREVADLQASTVRTADPTGPARLDERGLTHVAVGVDLDSFLKRLRPPPPG